MFPVLAGRTALDLNQYLTFDSLGTPPLLRVECFDPVPVSCSPLK